MARAGMTWEKENKNKHWLAFWRNAKGQKWQGLRIAIMERNSELWKNVITENGTETDQMILQFRLWDLFGDIGSGVMPIQSEGARAPSDFSSLIIFFKFF